MQEIQKTQVRSPSWEDLLEEEMATHPNILAWKIPWMEELGRLQSMGLQESDTTELFHFHLMKYYTFFLHTVKVFRLGSTWSLYA